MVLFNKQYLLKAIYLILTFLIFAKVKTINLHGREKKIVNKTHTQKKKRKKRQEELCDVYFYRYLTPLLTYGTVTGSKVL